MFKSDSGIATDPIVGGACGGVIERSPFIVTIVLSNISVSNLYLSLAYKTTLRLYSGQSPDKHVGIVPAGRVNLVFTSLLFAIV